MRGPTNSAVTELLSPLRQALRGKTFDVVLFEGLDALLTEPVVRRMNCGAIRVFDAQNIDHALLARTSIGGEAVERIRRLESNLEKHVDAFFACSDQDRETLAKLNRNLLPGFLVPNGVDTMRLPFDSSTNKAKIERVLFCGALNYAPNVEGLRWFYGDVWPLVRKEVANASLIVVGQDAENSVADMLRGDNSVELVGTVDDVVPYYHRTSVAVVPLLTGSGTRLKVLEAMSLGNPVVSTAVGAQGIRVRNGEHLLIADRPEDFARSIVRLMADSLVFDRMRDSARQLVENVYDWKVIGRQLNETISRLLQSRTALKNR